MGFLSCKQCGAGGAAMLRCKTCGQIWCRSCAGKSGSPYPKFDGGSCPYCGKINNWEILKD